MILTDARTAVRSETNHDDDEQVTDDQIDEFLLTEYRALRARLSLVAPEFYVETDEEQTLVAGDEDLTLPTDFQTLERLEKQAGDDWYPVGVGDRLAPWCGLLNFRREGDVLKLAPARYVAGTYRIVYVAKPLDPDDQDDEELHVPDGCEDIIVQRACAKVRVRMEEDPTIHLATAERIWAEQKSSLRRKYGRHPVPGLKRVRGW